jgi:hypothetical protein
MLHHLHQSRIAQRGHVHTAQQKADRRSLLTAAAQDGTKVEAFGLNANGLAVAFNPATLHAIGSTPRIQSGRRQPLRVVHVRYDLACNWVVAAAVGRVHRNQTHTTQHTAKREATHQTQEQARAQARAPALPRSPPSCSSCLRVASDRSAECDAAESVGSARARQKMQKCSRREGGAEFNQQRAAYTCT